MVKLKVEKIPNGMFLNVVGIVCCEPMSSFLNGTNDFLKMEWSLKMMTYPVDVNISKNGRNSNEPFKPKSKSTSMIEDQFVNIKC